MSISLHPGTIDTDLSRHAGSLVQRLGRLVTYTVSYGAITSLYAGTAPDAGELNGKVGNIRALNLRADLRAKKMTPVSDCLGTAHASEQEGARS